MHVDVNSATLMVLRLEMCTRLEVWLTRDRSCLCSSRPKEDNPCYLVYRWCKLTCIQLMKQTECSRDHLRADLSFWACLHAHTCAAGLNMIGCSSLLGCSSTEASCGRSLDSSSFELVEDMSCIVVQASFPVFYQFAVAVTVLLSCWNKFQAYNVMSARTSVQAARAEWNS